MPQSEAVPSWPEAHDPLSNADFWRIDLRVGEHDAWSRHVDDAAWRLIRVSTLFRTKAAVIGLAKVVGLRPEGNLVELQRRIANLGARLLPWLLLAQFAARKHPAALDELARMVLPPAWIEAQDQHPGAVGRLEVMLMIARSRPSALPWLRGLHAWHSRGVAALALGSRPVAPPGLIADRLADADWVNAAVAEVARPEGTPQARFEMAFQQSDGATMVVLRRGLRRGHVWDDAGERLHHGHDEELVALRFSADGRRVGLSSTTGELPRRLADAIATAWFGEAVAFVDVVETAPVACVERMLTALVSRQPCGLSLVEVGARNTPFPGRPEVILRAVSGDITAALADYAALGRPLASHIDDLVYLRVRFRRRVVLVDLERDGADRVVVRFADGRMDRKEADALRKLLATEFAVRATSVEARVA